MSSLNFKFNGISFHSVPFDVNKPFKLIVENYSGINPPIQIKQQKFSIHCFVNTEDDDILPRPDSLPNLPDERCLSASSGTSIYHDLPCSPFSNDYLPKTPDAPCSPSTNDSAPSLPSTNDSAPSLPSLSSSNVRVPDDDEISLGFDSQTTTSDSSTNDEIKVPKRCKRVVKDKVPLTRSRASATATSNSKNYNHLLNDNLLQLQTKVHVLNLPDFMINSKLSASKLDEIYSHQTDNLFEKQFDFVRRHIPKYIQSDSESDEDGIFFNMAKNVPKSYQINQSNQRNQRNQVNFDDDTDDLEESDKSSDKINSDKVKRRIVTRSRSERRKRRVRVLLDDSDESELSETGSSEISDINLDDDDDDNDDNDVGDVDDIDDIDDDDDDDDDNDNDNDSVEEITELRTVTKENATPRKRRPWQTKRKKHDYILLSSDEGDDGDDKEIDQVEIQEEVETENMTEGLTNSQKKARKNIKRVLTEAELENETKEATSKERKRVERITELEKQHARLLPEIEKDIEEPSLILDIDIETKKVRVEVNRTLVKELKPHQLDGIKFLYNSTIENVDKLEEGGSGCILAHCMGLGKSLQVISFVHTLLSNPHTKVHIKTILIVVPVNTLKNWAEEFDKWITKKELKCFKTYEMVDEPDVTRKAQLVENWSNSGGVLIIGIPALANLINLNVSKKKAVPPTLVRTLEKQLCNPGPDMLIIDEGHLLKDHKTRICKSVDRIKTKRKIVLTGTPLQNNLDEYHTMISIIKPRLLGSKKEFANRFRNPIENGQKADSNSSDVRLMKQRSTILNKLLSGCIQRFGYETLKPYLKPKLEYTIFIRPTKKIAEMYNYYLDYYRVQKDKLLWDANTLRLCVNHPALYQLQADSNQGTSKQKGRRKNIPLPEDLRPIGKPKTVASNGNENASTSANKSDQPSTSKAVDQVENCAKTIEQEASENLGPEEENVWRKDWFKRFSQPDDWKNIELSGKFIILFKLLRSCIAVGDKLLVVSQSLETLHLIEKLLKFNKEVKINNETVNLSWKSGRNYFRIDGSNTAHERLYSIRQFNDPKNSEARLFLLSTKAGGVGINLIAANRCVIFDVSWNPSDDIQAIFRVYRFGQPKPVYVYRFVTKDTMEEKIFRKQIVKLGMAIRVIDKHQVKRAFKAAELAEFYAARPKEEYEISLPDVPQDRILADILHIDNKEVLEYMEFDSLLEKKPDEELTEDERQAAWAEYQKERDAEIKAAEERKQAMEVERQKSEKEMMEALKAEEERLNLENERKKLNEILAAEKVKASNSSSATDFTVAPTTVNIPTVHTPSTSASPIISETVITSRCIRHKIVSSAPKQQTSSPTSELSGQDKLPTDAVAKEKQPPKVNIDANTSKKNSNEKNVPSEANVPSAVEKETVVANDSVQKTNQSEEVTADTETGSEKSSRSPESNPNNDEFSRPKESVPFVPGGKQIFIPQRVHNVMRPGVVGFVYKTCGGRPRAFIPNLSSVTRAQRKRKLPTSDESILKKPTTRQNVKEKKQAEEEATKNAIDNAFQNRRVYGFENATTSSSESSSTYTTRSSTAPTTSSARIMLPVSGDTNGTRTIHQHQLRNQGPYSNLNHPTSEPYQSIRSRSNLSPSTPSTSQYFSPPQAHQGLSSSSSSAFTGVSPGSGNKSNQQQIRDYGDYLHPLPPHQPIPHHHTSSPYLSNRTFTEAPPNFDQSSSQQQHSNGNSSTSSQPVAQPIASDIASNSDQNNLQTLNHPAADPVSENPSINREQSISSDNQLANQLVTMTDDACDEILSKFSDINLTTCSFSDLVQKLLTLDDMLVDSAECAETIIIEIEKILTALKRKREKLHSKSCVDLLSEVEVIEKISCERMLENLRKQVDSVATIDHSPDNQSSTSHL